MPANWTRRTLLGTGAATAIGAALPAPFVGRALAASGKITVGMEAGSPYDTFYRAHAGEFTAASGVEVEFISIPHDNIRQQFVLDALSGAGGFDVYIADQVWLPEFYEKGFIRELSGLVTDADRSDFSKTALETVTYDGALVALPVMVHNCALYYRTDLFEKAGPLGPAGELGRVPRFRPQDHRRAGRHLGHAGGVQAGHRGLDPAALALSAGGRRPAGRGRQADHQLGCRPGRARVHDGAGLRGQGGAGGRAGAHRHAGPVAGGQAGDGAGLALPLLALQGAAGRQVRHRDHARPRAPRRHGLLLGLRGGERRPRTPRAPTSSSSGRPAPTGSTPSARSG